MEHVDSGSDDPVKALLTKAQRTSFNVQRLENFLPKKKAFPQNDLMDA